MLIERGKGKVGLIGTGMVGASFAYSLMQSGLASELVLIDKDEARAQGEAMDLQHGLPFVRPMRIRAGGYDLLAGCVVVVICAGANQRPGETRLDLLQKNAGVFRNIIPRVVAACPEAIIVIATNPVDILTYISAEIAGLPFGHVIGSGTTLDTARFRFNLGDHFDVDPRSVHAWIVAEHGDSAVPVWSLANIGGIPLAEFHAPNGRSLDAAQRQRIFEQTRDAGYAIIQRKQSTYYAIGMALLSIVVTIIRDQRTVMPVSLPLTGQYGVSGMALSLPAVVGRSGAEDLLEIPMNDQEIDSFRKSALKLKSHLRELGSKS
ncbi:MAG: L-lactate dehydrogenase [Burkholderiales bacterium]